MMLLLCNTVYKVIGVSFNLEIQTPSEGEKLSLAYLPQATVYLPTRLRLHSRGVTCPTVLCVQSAMIMMKTVITCSLSAQRVLAAGRVLVFLLHECFFYFAKAWWETKVYWSIEIIVWNNVTETIQQICERAEFFLSSWGNAQEVRNSGVTSTMQHIGRSQVQADSNAMRMRLFPTHAIE